MNIARKLAFIGEKLGCDGVSYCIIRTHLEDIESQNNPSSEEIIEIVNKFYRLILVLDIF